MWGDEGMASVKGITIELMPTNKTSAKLRAIAKHAEALANELDTIDNAWECPNCGASNYSDLLSGDKLEYRQCDECCHAYSGESITNNELPTRIEGSE